jgi:hypothetical protein
LNFAMDNLIITTWLRKGTIKANRVKKIFKTIFQLFADIMTMQDGPHPLKKELDYYFDHQRELVKQYKGKYLVIKNQMVIGVYDSETEAETAMRYNEPGTFLILKCELYTGVNRGVGYYWQWP